MISLDEKSICSDPWVMVERVGVNHPSVIDDV